MRRALATALALAAVLAGCGGDDDEFEPIPSRLADSFEEQLADVEELVERGRCGSARTAITGERSLRRKIERLPDGVDPELRRALEDGVDRLLDLVEQECEPPEREETETETVPTETVPTETVPTETVPTETETEPEPTDTEPVDPVPTDELPTVPDDGSGGTGPPGEDGGARAPRGNRGGGNG